MSEEEYQKIWEATKELPLQMCGTFIAVRMLEKPKQKTLLSGIQVANDEQDHNIGLVLSAGDECKTVKAGMLIAFSSVATAYKSYHQGEKLAILGEAQVYGAYSSLAEGMDINFGKGRKA